MHALMARKDTSLADWTDLAIDGQPLVDTVRGQTAMLVSADDLAIDARTRADGVFEAEFKLKLQPGFELGSAVPVTADGYFLTASHCLSAPDGTAPAKYVVAIVEAAEGGLRPPPPRSPDDVATSSRRPPLPSFAVVRPESSRDSAPSKRSSSGPSAATLTAEVEVS